MSAPHGFALSVDLGTSNTVAGGRWPDGRTRPGRHRPRPGQRQLVGGRVLLTPTSGATNVALTGVNLSGKRTPLGSLEEIHSGSCSWNKEFLTCPAEDGFRAWRFTG